MAQKLSDADIVKRAKAGCLKTDYQQKRLAELLNESVVLLSLYQVGAPLPSSKHRVEELVDICGHTYLDRPVRRDCNDCDAG